MLQDEVLSSCLLFQVAVKKILLVHFECVTECLSLNGSFLSFYELSGHVK